MDRPPHSIACVTALRLSAALAATLFVSYPAAAQVPSASPQPVFPHPAGPASQAPSPVVDNIVGSPVPVLTVRKPAARAARKPMRYRVARLHHRHALRLDRPALAGVLLVEPIPERTEAPRPIVPMPAYFIDALASPLTTPPPPVVCAPRRREPGLPDPHLYREVPLACHYDVD